MRRRAARVTDGKMFTLRYLTVANKIELYNELTNSTIIILNRPNGLDWNVNGGERNIILREW